VYHNWAMRYRRVLFAVVAAVLLVAGVRWVAGDPGAPPPAAPPAAAPTTAAVTTAATTAPPETTGAVPTATGRTPVVPSVLGRRLGAAVTTLVAEGYGDVVPVDAAGDKIPLNPENWVVEGQDPAAGTAAPTSTRVRLTVVKPTESPQPAGDGLPDVVCTDLPTARAAIAAAGHDAGLADGSGRDRLVLVESNWLVIAQSPPAGVIPPDGAAVRLTVVKYGEPTGASGCRS
jgi:hypothetical protein